jgi:2-haloacid dehalogenase
MFKVGDSMSVTLAFDVYGTLIDTQGVIILLEQVIGEKAPLFSETWRQKQLEYSFRRGLMKRYENFSVCTSDALDYTCDYHKTPLSNEQKTLLLKSYQTLPAFSDVEAGLESLKDNYRLFAFSNGKEEAVNKLLCSAGIRDYFIGIVSVDELKSFKPDPDVYNHLLKRTDSGTANTWLISSNSFDVIGAMSVGMNAAWIKRSDNAIFDPWGIEPTRVASNLLTLKSKLY